MTVQLPAASLELTDEVSDADALQLNAYRELLFARNELELVNGAVQVRLVPGPPDDDGQPDHGARCRCRHRWRRAMRAARGSST